MRRRRRHHGSEGATDIAFLMLFLLMFSLVNIEEGTPEPVRMMDTVPIFRVPGAAAVTETTSVTLRLRLFPGGFSQEEAAALAGPEGCVEVAPNQIDSATPGLVELVWDRPERPAGALLCRVGAAGWSAIESGDEDILSKPLAAILTRLGRPVAGQPGTGTGSWSRIALEINRSTAFEFVHQAGEGVRLAARDLRNEGRLSGDVEVYYLGQPAGPAPKAKP